MKHTVYMGHVRYVMADVYRLQNSFKWFCGLLEVHDSRGFHFCMYSFVDNPTSLISYIPYSCITSQAYHTNIIGQYKLIILHPLHSYWLWPSWRHWKWPSDFHDNYFWFNCHIFMWWRLSASAIPRIFKDLPSRWKLDWRTSSMCWWVINMQKHDNII